MRFPLLRRCQMTAFVFLLSLCGPVLVANQALAKDRSVKTHGRERDFYALSEDAVITTPTTAAHSNCYMTSSPAEAARGIRHWNGSC